MNKLKNIWLLNDNNSIFKKTNIFNNVVRYISKIRPNLNNNFINKLKYIKLKNKIIPNDI